MQSKIWKNVMYVLLICKALIEYTICNKEFARKDYLAKYFISHTKVK